MNIHVIIDHPYVKSFNYAVLNAFRNGINDKKHTIDILDLNADQFNPIMSPNELQGYTKGLTIDPKVEEYQSRLLRSEHLVMVFPIWWMVMPSRLKGWMDKILLPGFAFTEDENPQPLLTHIHSATIFTTTAVPDKTHRSEFNNALHWVLCKGTLSFVGIQDIKWFNFGETGVATKEKHDEWLKFVKDFAAKL